jgi:hypothetical protein
LTAERGKIDSPKAINIEPRSSLRNGIYEYFYVDNKTAQKCSNLKPTTFVTMLRYIEMIKSRIKAIMKHKLAQLEAEIRSLEFILLLVKKLKIVFIIRE